MDLLFKSIKSGEFAGKLNKLTDKDIQLLNRKIHKKSNTAFEEAVKKYSK